MAGHFQWRAVVYLHALPTRHFLPPKYLHREKMIVRGAEQPGIFSGGGATESEWRYVIDVQVTPSATPCAVRCHELVPLLIARLNISTDFPRDVP